MHIRLRRGMHIRLPGPVSNNATPSAHGFASRLLPTDYGPTSLANQMSMVALRSGVHLSAMQRITEIVCALVLSGLLIALLVKVLFAA